MNLNKNAVNFTTQIALDQVSHLCSATQASTPSMVKMAQELFLNEGWNAMVAFVESQCPTDQNVKLIQDFH